MSLEADATGLDCDDRQEVSGHTLTCFGFTKFHGFEAGNQESDFARRAAVVADVAVVAVVAVEAVVAAFVAAFVAVVVVVVVAVVAHLQGLEAGPQEGLASRNDGASA